MKSSDKVESLFYAVLESALNGELIPATETGLVQQLGPNPFASPEVKGMLNERMSRNIPVTGMISLMM